MTMNRDAKHAVSGAVRRQVCAHCGGPFGMVTHRWWGSKFCKRRCKQAYLREIMLDRDAVHRWCGWLGLISPFDRHWNRREAVLRPYRATQRSIT